MDKDTAIKLIDDYKNGLTHPVELLQWTWLRVIVDQISNEQWEHFLEKALGVLSK